MINSTFTPSAKSLAGKTNILLLDRRNMLEIADQ
ncbi:hypothetical protein FZC85_18100 [Rossellomorea aquimaris]|uniref:Uncharacterized protein n=1 Tax=Rossellomorea aquimaris TaxID=189382 RepID=A0A5D4U7G7_9BACI|nr:hypothetical protein FZD05_17500 [Rossellomorea aquimaris]TYS83118.1 hypothetical protein FZC85_18100 [Rossellomorea aquimaris]